MSRQKWRMAAAALLIAMSGALFTGLSNAGQVANPSPASPGRFQIQTAGAAPNSTVFVLDTHTGQVWYKQTIQGDVWADMGSPTIKDVKR